MGSTKLNMFCTGIFLKTEDRKEGEVFYIWVNIRNTWKVLKCGAGEGWRRSVGPIT
jgi:hypothetical protein